MNLTSAIRLSVLCLVWPLCASAAPAGNGQQYDYRVTYRGVFSLGEEMPIADLSLHTLPDRGQDRLGEARLEASSAAYPTVETLYPMRYRFRSWYTGGDGHLVGFESYEQTDRRRHRLYLRDDSRRGVRSYKLGRDEGREEMALLDAGARPAASRDAGPLFDRLGLLQRIRGSTLRDDVEFQLPVTNGRDRLVYRVKVEGSQMLEVGGRLRPAWKVRFDGYEPAKDGREELAHRPVFIWFSQDLERIPLRADVRHAVGLFRIELKGDQDTRQLVSNTP